MKQRTFYIFAIILFAVLSACGPSQAELDVTATQMAVEESASQTAAAPTATPTLTPTNTVVPTNTATPTPTNTPTPTLEPGLYVPADYATIQAAIDAAVDGDVIIVFPGTYSENIDCTGKNITVRSTYPEKHDEVATTIIEDEGSESAVICRNG